MQVCERPHQYRLDESMKACVMSAGPGPAGLRWELQLVGVACLGGGTLALTFSLISHNYKYIISGQLDVIFTSNVC